MSTTRLHFAWSSLFTFAVMGFLVGCKTPRGNYQSDHDYIGLTREDVLQTLRPTMLYGCSIVIDRQDEGREIFKDAEEIRASEEYMRADFWDINPRGGLTFLNPQVWDHLVFENDIVVKQSTIRER